MNEAMPWDENAVTVTVRMPASLKRRAMALAHEEKVSLNAFLVEGIKPKVRDREHIEELAAGGAGGLRDVAEGGEQLLDKIDALVAWREQREGR